MKSKTTIREFLKPTRKKIGLFILVTLVVGILLQLIFAPYPYWYAQISNSMYPELARGDIIFVRNVAFDDIVVGDVVIHEVKGLDNPWVMRVQSINYAERTFTTKGDNNRGVIDTGEVSQKDLSENMLLAKKVARVPLLGYLEFIHVGWLVRFFLFYLISCFLVQILFSKVKKRKTWWNSTSMLKWNLKQWLIYAIAILVGFWTGRQYTDPSWIGAFLGAVILVLILIVCDLI